MYETGVKTSALLLLVTSVLGLAACSKTQPAPQRDASPAAANVTLALNWVPEPEFGGFYAARESGSYARHGLEVQILGGGAGVPVVQMVATARADFGTVGGDELVTARARGADLVALFATFQTSPQGIMAHASRKLDGLRDVFRSGTLAIEPGLAYAEYLKRQFPWDGVKIVPYDGGVARFLTDPMFAQQCYVTSEPIAARRRGGDPRVFLIADAGFNPYATVVVTRTPLVRERPDMVRAFVAATVEGWQAYLSDPQPTNRVLARLNPTIDGETMTAAAEAQKPLIVTAETQAHGLGAMSVERWRKLAEQLRDLGQIDRAPDPSELMVAGR
jgi:NitT/TauT family transport system substrate-binding protein